MPKTLKDSTRLRPFATAQKVKRACSTRRRCAWRLSSRRRGTGGLYSLYDTYKEKGLVVVGIHTPEFAFEKSTSRLPAHSDTKFGRRLSHRARLAAAIFATAEHSSAALRWHQVVTTRWCSTVTRSYRPTRCDFHCPRARGRARIGRDAPWFRIEARVKCQNNIFIADTRSRPSPSATAARSGE